MTDHPGNAAPHTLSKGAVRVSNGSLPEATQDSITQENTLQTPLIERDSFALPRIVGSNRQVLTQADFDAAYQYDPPRPTAIDRLWAVGARCKPTPRCCADTALDFFPFVGILRAYKLRSYLVRDILSGFTVAIMHIPQGKGGP